MNAGRQGPLRRPKRKFIFISHGPGRETMYPVSDDSVVQFVVELECGHMLQLHVGNINYTGWNGAKVKCDQCPTKKRQYENLIDEAFDSQ